MTKRRTIPLMQHLAVAVAEGRSIADWCRQTGTPERTAYTWAKLDEFKSLLAEIQERTLSTAVRKLAHGSTKAADTLVRLLDSSDERIQLSAARAILGDLDTFDGYVNIKERLAALERTARREPIRREA